MNLDEVARRARVSKVTVSRVLNNTPTVKNTTRRRVLKAVQSLKYQPDLHARSLAAGKNPSIGVIVSNIENPFFLDIYRAAAASARAKGYEVIMANTDYRPERLAGTIRDMIGQRVAGLAVISEMDPALIADLHEYEIPVVCCDAGDSSDNLKSIRVNYQRGVDKLTDYLRSLGHRRIGVVGNRGVLRPVDERMNIVVQSVGRYPDMEVQTAVEADSPEGGRLATHALLSAHPELTAITFVHDFMAIGAMREISRRGWRIPEDISIAGLDDIALAQYWYPALTSVHIPREQIGQRIFDGLVSDDNARRAMDMVVEPELVVRDSTGRSARS